MWLLCSNSLVGFRLTPSKNQSFQSQYRALCDRTVFPLWSFSCFLPTSISLSSHWLSCCPLTIPGLLLPQDLCTCCPLCIEWPSPMHLLILLFCLPQISAQKIHHHYGILLITLVKIDTPSILFKRLGIFSLFSTSLICLYHLLPSDTLYLNCLFAYYMSPSVKIWF